jgi:hypothetical protein
MHIEKGQILELILEDGYRYVRVSCSASLIPSPGQYLLASDGSDSPLPVPLFYTDFAPQGFISTVPDTVAWTPGRGILLRGPLGRGFMLPLSARKVCLVAFDDSPSRLRGLIRPALAQDAAVVLVCESAPENLADDVEVQPLSTLCDILAWANYAAFDVTRENLPRLREQLGKQRQQLAGVGAQVLVRTPVPCGGIADCGICAVTTKSEWKLACKDGPVFDWRELD